MSVQKQKLKNGKALTRLNKLSGNKAIIMGDVNARHVTCDTQSDFKSYRLHMWEKDNGWRIYVRCKSSCVTLKRSSLSDIMLTKDIDGTTATTRWNMDIGSDHFPVEMNFKGTENNTRRSPSKTFPESIEAIRPVWKAQDGCFAGPSRMFNQGLTGRER